MLRSPLATSARKIVGLFALIVLLVGVAGIVSPTYAEPEVIRTTPLDGEILPRTPTAVGVGFAEALDPEQSTFQVLTLDGTPVEGIGIDWGTGNSSVTISLPKDFPEGVYTITWHAVSANDGSSAQGWSSFSFGNPEDANIITIPTAESGHAGPPDWLRISGRFVAILGIAASMAIWPIWRAAIRPAVGHWRKGAADITHRIQNWAWVALGVAFVGSLVELFVHSQTLHGGGLIDAVMQTLGNNEWGFWWLARMALLVLLGLTLSMSPWWYPTWSKFADASLWVLSLALPLPLVLSGHAVVDDVGRVTTATSMWLSYLSLGVLAGGAFMLVIALRSMRESNEAALKSLRTRSIWLITTATATAIVLGIYLGSLFAGNLDALTQTAWGWAQLVQAGIAIVFVVIAIVLLARSFSLPAAKTLATALSIVAVLGLVTSAAMDVFTPARAELTERSVQTREDLMFDGRPGIFLVAPGEAGVNHWRLETPGTYLQTETEVFVELSSPTHPELGTKTSQMYRVQGNAFEHHGTELSVIGEWQFTIRIEEPGFEPSVATYTQYVGEENTTVNLPDVPWKFGEVSGLTGIGLVLTAIVGFSTALIAGKSPLRKEAGGLAAVAVALAVVIILQGRIDPLLVVEEGGINPNDAAMVQRGEESYLTYCASCHGVGLRGDGPLAESLDPPPVDFAQPHTKVHSDEDMIYWIQYGIQGTAMPGFRTSLEDQDIRDLLSFIYWWQQDDGESYNPPGGEATPVPELAACSVAPLEYYDLQALFNHGLHPETRRGTPLVRMADSNVPPEETNEVMWTIEQMVNCANADQFLSQARLFTTPMIQEIFPQGASFEVTQLATSPVEPVDPADAITIQDVQSISYLADGRVAVTVIFNDPAGIGVIPGVDPISQVTLIFIEIDGTWYVDEVR